MRTLFDTNVVLDLMLDRTPFADDAAQLFSEVESGRLIGFLSATTMTTIHYLASKVVGRKQAEVEIRKLLSLFEVAAVNRAVIENAMGLNWPDFEDAVLHEAASHANVKAVVTRNSRDFKRATAAIFSPKELLMALAAQRKSLSP